MSVESEILRIQRNVADTYAAVAEKGGTVPLQPNSENLPAAVSSIPAGGSSSGGTPVGTVISFIGLTAPAGYLVCDGAEYELTAYPALSELFRQQFGGANHFGGNGTTTFSVPDMRNLFLRGYHGEAEEQLSGEIGARQEPTFIPNIVGANNGNIINYAEPNAGNRALNVDTNFGITKAYYYSNLQIDASVGVYTKYSTRPVNMAVLYCIKAV